MIHSTCNMCTMEKRCLYIHHVTENPEYESVLNCECLFQKICALEFETGLCVAAIDFGTTYSGWAFSFKHEYDADPTLISSKQWYGGQHVSLKAPTTVLIKPDGRTLEAFGYDAETRYAELAAVHTHHQYFYFKRFKMILYDRIGFTRDISLEDDKGLSLPAKTVFALAIRHLKDDLLKTCNNRLLGGNIDEDEIHWVLTVPAIWNDAAKQFMREAAVEGGIKTGNLTIALEPEVASLFCRLLPVEQLVLGEGKGTSVAAFKPGSKYMVLDAGGGTVDITVHQVLTGGTLKELHKASGGACGGTKVDESFQQMLITIVGLPVLRRFQREFTDDYLDMFREFEVKKRDIVPDKDSKISLRFPSGLKDVFLEETDEDLRQKIEQTHYAGHVYLMGDKLRMDSSVYKGLFKDAVDEIVEHVQSLLKESDTVGVDAILMVGGFSESAIVQLAVKSNFPNMKVIIPKEAGLVVLKGAVVFGHNPACIAERVCRYTYGISIGTEFQDGIHDSARRVKSGGKWYCYDLFDKHVEVGETVKYGESQTKREYIPLTETQKSIPFSVYASSSPSPKYVTECGKIGSLETEVRDMTVPHSERIMIVSFTFSGTEIEIKAKEKRTGHVTNATINFLG